MSTHTRTPMRAWTYSYFYAAEKKNISICQVRYMVPVETIPACRTGVGGALACHNLKASDWLQILSNERAGTIPTHFVVGFFQSPSISPIWPGLILTREIRCSSAWKSLVFSLLLFSLGKNFRVFKTFFSCFPLSFVERARKRPKTRGSPPFYRPAILIEEGIKVPWVSSTTK